MLAVMLCSLGTVAHADLPLAVESLLTDKGKLKLNLSLAYSNSATTGGFNSDAVVGTTTLRYGLTGKTEIYVRSSGLYSNIRTSADPMTETRFLNTWAGASYQFKKDTETPALIGFVEGALFERGRDSTYALKSLAIGLTAYKSIDPIVFVFSCFRVFVFSGYYGLNLPRKDGGATINPGNTLMLNPSVAFSVNDRVTLNTGVRWTNTWPWHIPMRQYRKTNTDLQLGVDYGFSDDNILNVTFSSNVSGTRGSNLRLDWLHTF